MHVKVEITPSLAPVQISLIERLFLQEANGLLASTAHNEVFVAPFFGFSSKSRLLQVVDSLQITQSPSDLSIITTYWFLSRSSNTMSGIWFMLSHNSICTWYRGRTVVRIRRIPGGGMESLPWHIDVNRMHLSNQSWLVSGGRSMDRLLTLLSGPMHVSMDK